MKWQPPKHWTTCSWTSQRHLLRREEDPEGPSEDGPRRQFGRRKGRLLATPRRDPGPDRTLGTGFELLGKAARGKTCEAIQGIIAEREEIIEEFKESPALDAGLISSAQAVEHYEIARYGTLIEWAKQLGLKDAVPLLEANLAEEKATDEKLTQLATASANAKGKTKAS